MEAKDVLLLVAGPIPGYLMSLLATFSAPPLSSVFGKLKSGWIERNKAKALANYVVARDLNSGKWDKYLYALNSWGFVIAHLVFCAMGTTVGLLHSDPIIRLVGAFSAACRLARCLRRTGQPAGVRRPAAPSQRP
jgi:hypothetical protein